MRVRHLRRWLLIGGAVVVLLVVGGPFVYFNVIEGKAPARLSLSSNNAKSSSTTTGAGVPLDGTWKVAGGSQAGYRVKEILFGQNHEAVGRTSNVTGQITISGTTVNATTFTVDLTTVSSDQSRPETRRSPSGSSKPMPSGLISGKRSRSPAYSGVTKPTSCPARASVLPRAPTMSARPPVFE